LTNQAIKYSQVNRSLTVLYAILHDKKLTEVVFTTPGFAIGCLLNSDAPGAGNKKSYGK